MTQSIQRFLLLLCSVLLSTGVFAKDAISTSWTNDLAVSGYDTVAYHTQQQAVEGDKAYQTQWQGATWQFSSADNLELFLIEPEKYAPQYGGYCAWAVSQGKTASSDPTQFEIVNGKLYLNYNKSIQKKWLADRDTLIVKAEQNWPDVIK
jgi:YHS domain-containing protein